MMFNIHTGYNVRQVPNEEIVILVSSLHRVAELGIPFVFTDQHAYPVMANFYSELENLHKVDWNLLNLRDFKHDPDDPGKKERYQAEALVNSVNTVGVMGKGIALMFKEAFPENFRDYEGACKRREVKVGRMFVTENRALEGPRWIINFPTKKHWRQPSKLEWIIEGLKDLRSVIQEYNIRSIALPPLGAGNGRLDWRDVRPLIQSLLGDLEGVDIQIYEPTEKYQNVAKRTGVEKLTPARVLVAEMIRRYWVLGIECTYLEVQKLGWFLERTIHSLGFEDPLKLHFTADKYGPYSERLRHMLNALDGTYLHCDKRLSDAGPSDTIWFNKHRGEYVDLYLKQDPSKRLLRVLDLTAKRIDGFESPFGMELLSTVDWLIEHEHAEPTVQGIRSGLRKWPAEESAAERKLHLFDDRLLGLALDQLTRDIEAEATRH